MNAEQFADNLKLKAKEIDTYARNRFPAIAGRKILRFIDGNFRAQGWQGSTFEPWKPIKRKGTILIKTGRLRRGNHQQTGPGWVRTWNDVPYAAAHNRGFNGTVNVKSYKRNIYEATKVGTGKFTKTGKERQKTVHVVKGQTTVKAHTRKMNLAKRQFFPESLQDSPVLITSIRRTVSKDLQNIIKQ